jgi:hypothetical protein
MIRQRISTFLTTLGLLLSMTAVSVALPASTLAATPDVHVGWGTEAVRQLTTAAEPATVSFGAYVQFKIWARNYDTSTVSQFFLTETDSRTIDSASWSSSDGTSGSCPTTPLLSCSFGQLKPRQSIDAVVVMRAPASGTSMPVNFVWSTVGIGHGDSFPVLPVGSVALNGTGDFSGRFLVSSDSLLVGNAGIGPGGSQSTAATVNASGIPVTVQDGSDFTPADLQTCTSTDTFDCADLFGDWSSVNVDNNTVFDSYFTITITIAAASIPNGVNKNNLAVYHQYFDKATSSWKQEVISATCSTAPVPCMILTTSKTAWVITIRTFHNGTFRTF